MTSPTLGTAVDGGAPVTLNLKDLIGTDICAVAKKGFGKSGLLRVLFEQTYGLIQQVILDPEDEFYTLREAGDYLVAGGDTGDCPAELANARALAKMLMENPGISAVIQLGHLEADVQEEFVALFITEIMATRREHWHPVLICLDETQRFAPQDQRVASSDVVKDMVRRGRKRGITPVFASLSHSSINKDVTRGVSTWLFGRVGTDIDRKLVANSLALSSSSAEARDLPFLPLRRFWAFGHPISDRPVLFDVADAKTTIVKSGGALVAMPPPPKRLEKLLAALAKAAEPPKKDAPPPADTGPAHVAPQPTEDVKAAIRREAHQEGYNNGYEQGHFDGYQKGSGEGYDRGIRVIMEDLERIVDEHRVPGNIAVDVDDRDLPTGPITSPPDMVPDNGGRGKPANAPARPVRQPRAPSPPREDAEPAEGLTAAQQRVLDTLRWWDDMGHKQVTRQRACVMAGYSPKASTFGVYISQLTKMNLVYVPAPGLLMLTTDGFEKTTPQKGRRSLTDAARELLDGRAREVFDILVEVGPSGISRHILADRMLLSRSASTLGVYISKASALGFIDIPRPGEVALASWLRT